MKKQYPKLIGAIHLVALLGNKKYKLCSQETATYFASVKFWDKDDEELRGDFQVFITSVKKLGLNMNDAESMKNKIQDLIAEEIVIAHTDGQQTNRLTSLSEKIRKL